MPVRWCQFVLSCWIFVRVSGIERVNKPVVFSYSSAALPHPATISHHYVAPVTLQTNSTEPPQDHKEDSSNNGLVYHPLHVHSGQGYNQPNQAFQISPQSHYYGSAPSSVIPPVVYGPSPTTYHPEHRYLGSTNLRNEQSMSSHNYDHHSYPAPSEVYSSVPPVVYYSTRPFSERTKSYNVPKMQEYQGYDIATTTAPLYDNHNEQSHTSISPTYNEPYNYDYSGQNYTGNHAEYVGRGGHDSSDDLLSTTSHPRNYDYSAESPFNATSPRGYTTASNHSDFLDSPSVSKLDHPSYGGKTRRRFRGKIKSVATTPSHVLDDSDDYVTTTPIIEFESVREKLPSIDQYPSPVPGYISRPFKPFSKTRKVTNKIPKSSSDGRAHRKNDVRSERRNNKVLQTPKFFAYSSRLADVPVADGGSGSEDDKDRVHDASDVGSGEVEGDDGYGKKKDEEYTKGGGQEHHSAHKASGGGKGEKGYTSEHKHSHAEKGHHDKEAHKKKYLDERGKKAEHKEEGGHYGEHHKAEKGKKSAKYAESGEHKKGHSTKGEHNIHKMDEYLKKHEFYDEHHEGGDHEKHGGFVEAHAFKKGGKKKKGHHKSGGHHHHKGKKGHYQKGVNKGLHKGHKDAKGYDAHFAHHKKHGKKGGSKKGMKWGYSKGHHK